MSKSYTPGLKILEKASVEKERILPLKGKVHVKLKEKLEADKIVASTKIPGNVQMVNVANALNVDPDQVPDCMLCQVDDIISKGEVIARSKGLFGMFKTEVKSPLDGILGNISDITGQVIISEKPYPIEVDAYIPGEVDAVFDNEGILVKSKGTLIQGIIGIGGEKKGCIAIESEDDDIKDKIVIVKSCLIYDFYEKLNRLGAKGIVCGGIDYSTMTKILKRPLGVAITGMEETTTIVVTEGFGDIQMANRTYQILAKNNGKFCSINGATQIRAGVMRPEIFIGSNVDLENPSTFTEDSLVISIGSKVRMIRDPYFGKLGVVKELPSELMKIDTETTARVAKITFEDGSEEIIPRTNLEVILSD